MSTPSELYNDYPAESSRLSQEQLQALHDYNQKTTNGEAHPDLRSLVQEPIPFLDGASPNHHPERLQNTDLQWNSWEEQDVQITRAPYTDHEDGKHRWKDLYEQWNATQRANNLQPITQEPSDSLCLDPHLQNIGTGAIQHHHDQILAMNAFLHLQAQEGRLQQESSTGNNLSEQSHVGQQQIQLARAPSPRSRLSIKNLLSFDNASNLSRINGPIDQSAIFVPGPSTYSNTPTQGLQTELLRDKKLEDLNASRVSLPSISFLPQPSDGYIHPTIHFPSLAYVVHDAANNSNHQYDDSGLEHDQPQFGKTGCDTPSSTPEPVAPRANDPRINSRILTHRPERIPLHLPKNIKKGTEPKKPHVPNRRWSRTHLNQLMRERRPRNLPESIELTDHVDVQDLPIEKLIPVYCVVGAENNGQKIQFGAGTRVEVPMQASGGSGTLAHGGFLAPNDLRSVVKSTPFRLVIRDQHGIITADMTWDSYVAVNDPVAAASYSGDTRGFSMHNELGSHEYEQESNR